MSYYSDHDRDRPRRQRRDRDRDRTREYVEEEQYVSRGGGGRRDDGGRDSRRQDLVVRRRDDSNSSVEEIQRDFAPGDGGYVKRTTRVREGVRPVRRARSATRYSDDYDDRRSEYSSRKSKRDRGDRRYDDRRDRRDRRRDDYSDESSRSRSRSRDKNPLNDLTEKALAALGLGAVAAKVRSRSRSRAGTSRAGSRSRRGRSDYNSRSRSRSRGGDRNAKLMQAVKAALAAGAAAAIRARKEPGGLTGEKGKKIITAAIAAAGVDGLLDRDPDKHSKRHIIESALAGLATTHFVGGGGGARSQSRGPVGRDDRGRSQSRGGGVRDLVAGGALAAAGKSLFDKVRSRSRGRPRDASRDSYSSYDSRSPPRRAEKKRSKSITDMARGALAGFGIGEAAKKGTKSRGHDYSSSEEDYPRDVGQSRSMPAAASGLPPHLAQIHQTGAERYENEPHHFGDPNTDSDSDLGSSTDEEKRNKSSRNRQLLTAGLATVATIHAAHNVWQSMEARDARHEAVKDGEMSHKEASKEKRKARLQDAAAIGIAALGIKGAVSEWKEVKEHRAEYKEEKEKIARHKQKREARRKKLQAMQANGLHPDQAGSADHVYGNASYASSAPHLQNPQYTQPGPYNPYVPAEYQYPQPMSNGGPVYHDGNPYASEPSLGPTPPPPGHGTYTPTPGTNGHQRPYA